MHPFSILTDEHVSLKLLITKRLMEKRKYIYFFPSIANHVSLQIGKCIRRGNVPWVGNPSSRGLTLDLRETKNDLFYAMVAP